MKSHMSDWLLSQTNQIRKPRCRVSESKASQQERHFKNGTQSLQHGHQFLQGQLFFLRAKNCNGKRLLMPMEFCRHLQSPPMTALTHHRLRSQCRSALQLSTTFRPFQPSPHSPAQQKIPSRRSPTANLREQPMRLMLTALQSASELRASPQEQLSKNGTVQRGCRQPQGLLSCPPEKNCNGRVRPTPTDCSQPLQSKPTTEPTSQRPPCLCLWT